MKKLLFIVSLVITVALISCGAPVGESSSGGELTGISAVAWDEPAPYGMVLIKRGSVKVGPSENR